MCGNALFDGRDSSLKPLGINWVDEIVQCMNIECLDCISAVGRDEHRERHVRHAHGFNYLEAGISGHLDVQKRKLIPITLSRGLNYACVLV
jgi:hypothetical protein